MGVNKYKQGEPSPATNISTNRPLSDTIENAHASGDGALERDKDTILEPKRENKGNDQDGLSTTSEAY